MDTQETTLLPPERPLRWRSEHIVFLRRQYEGLERWAAETGIPYGGLVRQAVDEALRRRGFGGYPAIVEAPDE
jgi:hypothetical protein